MWGLLLASAQALKVCGVVWQLSAARVSVQLGTLTVLLHWSTALLCLCWARPGGGPGGRTGGGNNSDRSSTLPGQS